MQQERPAFRELVESSGEDIFRDTFGKWISMPLYANLSPQDVADLKAISDPKRSSLIESFLSEMRGSVGEKRKSGDYDGALSALGIYHDAAWERFEGDDLLTVLRFIYYRTAYVLEYKATYAHLSHEEPGSKARTECFVKAALFYMRSDLVLGCASDYGARVSESLMGAGSTYVDFASKALVKTFGGNIELIGPNDKSGQVMVQSLLKRSQNRRRGLVPGGGEVTFVSSDDMPPSNSN